MAPADSPPSNSPPPDTPPPSPPSEPPRVSLWAIYKAFFWVGLFSFGGGVSAWLHREVVNVRGWMTDDQFFSGYSLTHVLPGVNATNLIVYIGQHLRGAAGAIVALFAMLTGPFVVVLGAAVAYQHLLQVPGFQAAMAGIAAAAIGMLVRLAVMSAKNAITGVLPVVIMAAIVFAIAVMRWPIVPVVLVAAPVSIALAWKKKTPHA